MSSLHHGIIVEMMWIASCQMPQSALSAIGASTLVQLYRPHSLMQIWSKDSLCGVLQIMEAQQQQQQLAMLRLMQEAGGFPAASLLSHGSAQGSSNLIYILKSLQVHALCR